MSDILLQGAVIAATLAVIIVSALANYLPINGQTTREISDRIQVYFTPAGYVFAIWGVIYLGLIAYTVFQALPMNQDNLALQSIAPYYLLGSAANIVWMLLWHYERFPLTPVFMIILLGALIMIYLGLDIGGGTVSTGMWWAVHLPFSIYLGWITVATIANITAVLWLANWDGFGIGPEIWTAIVLAVAVIIAAAVAVSRADVAYGLVLVWAFTGIYVKHSAVPKVGISALLAAVLVGLLVVVSLIPDGPLPLQS
ncbi:MAG: tryptophan-rich sensory protein [Gammaproteobacteria bacterium]|nr:tryptophan-rich sensory protein [Gammaproteobacteria bacterium]